jgi:hypothetical protein
MKVFISHSSQDKWVARKISEDLNRAGIETFLDEKDIVTGESIDETISQHLVESDELLIIISPASLTSQWVFLEIGGAKALGKRLVPILFHVGANELPALLSRYLARDLNDIEIYYQEAKKRATSPKAVPPAKRKPEKIRRPRLQQISPGDRVRIAELSELTDEQKLIPPTWVSSMDQYAGMTANVESVLEASYAQGGHIYTLSVDDTMHAWSALWLKRVD